MLREEVPTIRLDGRPQVSNVPEKISGDFWIINLLTTAVGEALSDFLVHHMNPYAAVVNGAVVFAASLLVQVKAKGYTAPVYWFAVAMAAVFGTLAANATHIALDVPYLYSSAARAALLGAVLLGWWAAEGTLFIHSIIPKRRELFYWATVLTAFTLGTAAAAARHLGAFVSGMVYGALFAIPGMLYFQLRLHAILAFWTAYVVTRRPGAGFADWLGTPARIGGLGYGHGPVAGIVVSAIVVTVGYITVARPDVKRPASQS